MYCSCSNRQADGGNADVKGNVSSQGDDCIVILHSEVLVAHAGMRYKSNWSKASIKQKYQHIKIGFFNPFLFIEGFFCTCSVKTSLTQNYLKLTIPRFPYNLLSFTCGDIGFEYKA